MNMAFALSKPPTIIDAQSHRIAVTASTQDVDAEGDIIRAKGWELSRVELGQCKLLNSHKKTDIREILGNVEVAMVRGAELVCEVTYCVNENPLASMAWKMTAGGTLRGYSVGYMPRAVAALKDLKDEDGKVVVKADRKLWDAVCADMGMEPKATAERARRIIVSGVLGELSACSAPVNPYAMTKALRDGALDEADFAAAGLAGSHTYDLIVKGAANWERMDVSQRDNFTALMLGISRNNLQSKGTGSEAAEKAQRERAESEENQRAEFLTACKALASKFEEATRL